MSDGWSDTFDSPRTRGLLGLAEMIHHGTGPRGAKVTVDAVGDVLTLTPGDEDLPATAALDIIAAHEMAQHRAFDAAQRYLLGDAALSKTLHDVVEAPQVNLDHLPRALHRGESDCGRAQAVVDATRMRLESLYLEDLSDATMIAAVRAIARAFDAARTGDPDSSLTDTASEVLADFERSLETIEGQLSLIDDRLTAAERNLR